MLKKHLRGEAARRRADQKRQARTLSLDLPSPPPHQPPRPPFPAGFRGHEEAGRAQRPDRLLGRVHEIEPSPPFTFRPLPFIFRPLPPSALLGAQPTAPGGGGGAADSLGSVGLFSFSFRSLKPSLFITHHIPGPLAVLVMVQRWLLPDRLKTLERLRLSSALAQRGAESRESPWYHRVFHFILAGLGSLCSLVVRFY